MLLHVRYVTDLDAGPSVSPLALLQEASGPWTFAGIAALLVGLACYLWLTTRWAAWRPFRRALDTALARDAHLVPWILRLASGIVLLGAGVQGAWIVPHLEIAARGALSILLIASGFAILVGLAVRIAASVAIVVAVAGLFLRGPDLMLAAELVAALVVLVAGAAGRPSLDEYLAASLPQAPPYARGLAQMRWLLGPTATPVPRWGVRLLQVGLGTSFLAAAVLEKFLAPGPALATAERYGLAVGPVPPETVVVLVGLLEAGLGLLLILGVAARPLAALAFLVLTVTLFALPDDPVVAHVGLWGIASAVFLLGPHRRAVHDDVPGATPGT